MVGPTHRRLVELTATRDRSVGELVDGTELSQPYPSNWERSRREDCIRPSGRKRLYKAEPKN
ncbi:hypothetical protein A4G99_08580 [Haladaptatus sp. R4]|uniref:hypothetical protein n=1 Tax=Haladaptatus sp. R4 TaxID=1679489 RepID=UPI0007B4F5DF|nr:hypothetical protein [Haladaptatus sp. R4]KZN24436.1 hypothetical protein A4G99_08580 [Haladaptatus sp. R4]